MGPRSYMGPWIESKIRIVMTLGYRLSQKLDKGVQKNPNNHTVLVEK